MSGDEGHRVPLPGGTTGPPPRGGLAGIEERRKRREPSTRLEAVQRSAQGWAAGQIAILGLLGVSGVARDADQLAALPQWVTWTMAALALGTFALAASAAVLIAVTAWPLYREQVALAADDDETVREDVLRAQGRLRLALPLTIGALVTMGATFALSWWPIEDVGTGHLVRIQTADQTVCGELAESVGPRLIITVGDQVLRFRSREVLRVEPVDTCDS
jgi:hypothetical protein